MKSDSNPYLPPDGIVYVIDSLDPGKKIPVQVVKTTVRSQRKIIESLACPECKNEMLWMTNGKHSHVLNMEKKQSTNWS